MKQDRLERVKLDNKPSTLSQLFDAFHENLSMKECNRFYTLLRGTLISAMNVPAVASMLLRYEEGVVRSLLQTAECINRAFVADQADELRQLLYRMIGLSPTVSGLWNNGEEARHNGEQVRPADPKLWLAISNEIGKRLSDNYSSLDRLTRPVHDETRDFREKIRDITSTKE